MKYKNEHNECVVGVQASICLCKGLWWMSGRGRTVGTGSVLVLGLGAVSTRCLIYENSLSGTFVYTPFSMYVILIKVKKSKE
jgi:hypothetical protein